MSENKDDFVEVMEGAMIPDRPVCPAPGVTKGMSIPERPVIVQVQTATELTPPPKRE
jgi:hypothetical protein